MHDDGLTDSLRKQLEEERAPTAQAVINALRFCLMVQHDPEESLKLVNLLVDLAPESLNDSGVRLLNELVAEGSLKLAVA